MVDTKERPILMSAPMVRATLREVDPKTQTRRVVKPQPDTTSAGARWAWPPADVESLSMADLAPRMVELCPYGQYGDRLWVRETWGDCTPGADALVGTTWDKPWYRADADAYGLLGHDGAGPVYVEDVKWRPSIHMPRKLSRITLEITGIRVERLQDISDEDAIAEGINRIVHGREGYFYHATRTEPHPNNWSFPDDAYKELWEQINGPGSWDANPWVWVIGFSRVTP